MQSILDIHTWLTKQAGVTHSATEAGLGGQSCALYSLGPHPLRYAFADLTAVMKALQCLCEQSAGFLYDSRRAPIFRPCPVFSLKQLFVSPASSPHKCRVVFDVDTSGTSQICSAEQLLELFCVWLSEHVERRESPIVWSEQRVYVWGGRFTDKPQSFHIYFPDFVWAPTSTNLYKNVNFATLNAILFPYGLNVDPSITSSGIKLFCSDKWLQKTKEWRGEVQTLMLYRVSGVTEDVSFLSWGDLFADCIPVVGSDFPAFENEVSFVPAVLPEPPRKRRPEVTLPHVATVAVAVTAANPISRLMEAVPEWEGAPLKKIQSGARPLCLVPHTLYCPLKTTASDDEPPFRHGTHGKAYAIVDALGGIVVRCQICPGDLTIPAPEVPAGRELEAKLHECFSGEWARGPPGFVIQRTQLTPSFRAARMVSHQHFVTHCTRNGEKVGKVPWPKYWLQMADVPEYANGFGFYPDHFVPDGFYNLYTGFDPVIEEAQKEFAHLAGEELLKHAPYWTDLVRQNICGDNPVLFEYFMKWHAHSIQRPHIKPGVAIVLIGKAGVGKGMSLTPGRLIHGRHGMQTDDIESRFNAYYANVIFLHVEELKKSLVASNALKTLITESDVTYEQKGKDRCVMRTSQHVAISSNDSDAVTWQAAERRFVAFPCTRQLANWGPEYQTQCAAELANPKAMAALKQYWTTLDIENWNPRVIPLTSANFKIQFASMSVYEKYIYFVLKRGDICSAEIDLPDGRDLNRITSLCEENARVYRHTVRPVAELGFRNWHKEYEQDAMPKSLFLLGFVQMFPREKKDCPVPLWKFLHELNRTFPDEPLFEVKQVRVPGNGNPRVECVAWLVTLDRMREAFQAHRGNLDPEVWTAQGGIDI